MRRSPTSPRGRRMRRMGVPLACGVAALLAACGPERQPPEPEAEAVRADTPVIHGRWRGEHDEVELFAGGRMLLHQGPYRVAGSYEMVEPGRVLLFYQNALPAAPPGDYRVAFTADSLTLCETDAPARCIRYGRVTAADSVRTAADSARRARATDDGTPPRLAAPVRPDHYPPEARAVEANGVLKQIYTLQQAYRAQNGRYASTLEELREVGWEPVPLRHFQQPRIVRGGERPCIAVQPRAADLWPVHIDADGRIGRGASCP